MKKNYMIYGIAALTCLLAAACAKVETAEPAQEEETLTENVVVFKATASEDDTKAEITLADGDFSWTATSDKIAVATNEGYKISTGATGVSGNKADFSVSLGTATLNTNAFALYPHTLVWDDDAEPAAARTDCNPSHDGDGDNLVVYLPDSYPIGDVTSPKVPCPMIASIVVDGEGALGNLSFKQLCAVLCIQVNSIPASANTLVLDFNGKKVSGKFEIETTVTPGASSIVAANDDAYDTITITDLAFADWKDNLVINIPVPTGVVSTNEFTNLTVTAKNGATTVLEMTRPIKVGANWVPQRAMRRKIVASLPAFSVADNVRVHIAKSNLQLRRPSTAKSWEATQAAGELIWEFMPESWSRISANTVSVDYASEGVITLFAWGTSGQNFGEYSSTYYQPWITAKGAHTDFGTKGVINLTGDFSLGDWGVKACQGGKTLDDGYGAYSTWRSLTAEECLFLFGKTQKPDYGTGEMYDATESSDTRYAKRLFNWGMGTINTDDESKITGMIVVPDYFVDPTDTFVKGNRVDTYNRFTVGQWSLMAAAGAAFLPNGGQILKNNLVDDSYYNLSSGCSYWLSTTPHETSGHSFDVGGGSNNWKPVPANTSNSRRNGFSIRLIRELN